MVFSVGIDNLEGIRIFNAATLLFLINVVGIPAPAEPPPPLTKVIVELKTVAVSAIRNTDESAKEFKVTEIILVSTLRLKLTDVKEHELLLLHLYISKLASSSSADSTEE
jgi:hypothetical protein